MSQQMRAVAVALLVLLHTSFLLAGPRPRARDLGVPFDGTPGTLNAITDVAGVEVGHTTLIKGEGKLVVGQDMTGINGRKVYALPHDRLREVLRKYKRLEGEK